MALSKMVHNLLDSLSVRYTVFSNYLQYKNYIVSALGEFNTGKRMAFARKNALAADAVKLVLKHSMYCIILHFF